MGTGNGRARLTCATAVAVLVQLLILAPQSAQAASDEVRGAALGQALRVQTGVVDPGAGVAALSARVDVAQAATTTDTGGIGAGGLLADATALGLGADVPGYLSARYSLADRHAPTGELPNPNAGQDSASKANAQVAGILEATTLSSLAEATEPPEHADGAAEVQSVNILPGPPEAARPTLNLSVLHGHASSTSVAPGAPGVEVAGDSGALMLNSVAAGLPIDIRALTANASATNHGGATALAQSCEVLVASLDPAGALEPIPCDSSSDLDLGVVLLQFGQTTTTATSTRIVALTISTFNPLTDDVLSVIELGIAEAAASRATAPPAKTACDETVRQGPTASGGAEGTVVRVRDSLGLLEVDGGISVADIDEAGVPSAPDDDGVGSDKGATARSAALEVEALPQPGDGVDAGDVLQLNDAHASAPLADAESTTIAAISPALPAPTNLLAVSGATLASEASASTDPDDITNLRTPTASAGQSVQSLDVGIDATSLGGGAPIPLSLGIVQTGASAERSASGVHGEASTNAASVRTTVEGIAIVAEAITGLTTADALDAGGLGTVATTFTILSLSVGDTVVAIPADSDGDGLPGPASIDVTDPISGDIVATVEFGMHVSRTTALRSAHITVDPVVIRVPGGETSPANTVVLGHMEAEANAVPAGGGALIVQKQVDIHYDALTFTDEGGIAAPHQKIWYSFCVGNVGTSALSDVQLTDTLDANLRAITSPEPDALPAEWSIAGQTITRPIGTLASGQEFRAQVLVEVRPTTPLGTQIPNFASASAAGVAPTPSNVVTVTVGISPNQPALFVTRSAPSSCNTATRVITLQLQVHNTTGAGSAHDAFIDALSVLQGGHQVLTALPIQIGDLAPGATAPFVVELRSPGLPGTPCVGGLLDIRERGFDAAGRGYAFD